MTQVLTAGCCGMLSNPPRMRACMYAHARAHAGGEEGKTSRNSPQHPAWFVLPPLAALTGLRDVEYNIPQTIRTSRKSPDPVRKGPS